MDGRIKNPQYGSCIGISIPFERWGERKMNGTAGSRQSKEEVALRALDEDVRLETLREMLAEFDLFNILGVERSELQHSRVLEWLLNPGGSHGLGNSFLRELLTCISSDSDKTGVSPAVVEGWDLLDVETEREQDRIDILVVARATVLSA